MSTNGSGFTNTSEQTRRLYSHLSTFCQNAFELSQWSKGRVRPKKCSRLKITILKEKAGDVDDEEEEPEVQVTARVVMDKEISANKPLKI